MNFSKYFKKRAIIIGICTIAVSCATIAVVMIHKYDKVSPNVLPANNKMPDTAINNAFNTNTNTNTNTKIFSSKYGFTFNYPESWDVSKDEYVSESKSNKFLSTSVIYVAKTDADKFLEYQLNNILNASEAGNSINEPLKKTEKDGIATYSFSINSKIESTTTILKHTYFQAGNKLFMFNSQLSNLTNEEYQNMVNSFKIDWSKINDETLLSDVSPDMEFDFIIYKLGYKVIVNSGLSEHITLPDSFENNPKSGSIGQYLKKLSIISKKYGYDFTPYMGKNIKLISHDTEQKDKSTGEIYAFAYNNKIVGIWRKTDTSLEESDFFYLKNNLSPNKEAAPTENK